MAGVKADLMVGTKADLSVGVKAFSTAAMSVAWMAAKLAGSSVLPTAAQKGTLWVASTELRSAVLRAH